METSEIVRLGRRETAAVTLDLGVCYPQDAAAEQGSLMDLACKALGALRSPPLRSRITETTAGILRDGDDWKREFHDRLISVSELPGNWDGEGAYRVDRAILNTARDLVPQLELDEQADMQVPQVAPDAAGHLHLVWWRDRDYFAIALIGACNVVCLTKQGDEFTQYYCATNDLPSIRRRFHAFTKPIP